MGLMEYPHGRWRPSRSPAPCRLPHTRRQVLDGVLESEAARLDADIRRLSIGERIQLYCC
jgi:hypothetical protein